MKPQRIQLKRTKGWRIPANTVIVDRRSKWGNPFPVLDHRNHGAFMAVRAFAIWASERRDWNEWLAPLRGKNLACWCKPGQPCHADWLLEHVEKCCV